MVRVSNCCGCCSLKAGMYTYGILMLISRGYSLIRLITTAVNNNVGPSGHSIHTSSSYENQANAEYALSNEYLYSLAAFIVIASILLIVALVGVSMEKRGLLVPHMVMLVIQIIIEVICTIWIATTPLGFVAVIFALDACLQVYIFICIYSFYHELKEKEQRPFLPVNNSKLGAF